MKSLLNLNKKNFKTIISFIIIDIICVGGWILYFKPSDDMSIALIFLIPTVFTANIIIAYIIYFIKKYYTPFFILNAFITPFMLFYFFGWYIEIDNKINLEKWEFVIDNKNYDISYWPNNTVYNDTIVYGVYLRVVAGSYGYDRGIVKEKNDTVYFFSVDSTQYYIYKDYLYNFKDIDKIKVKKKY